MTRDTRTELGAFLRSQRERPRDTGSAPHRAGERRRTPGLRREELADMAGMSPTWLTWIEQGRDVSASPAALSRLSDALNLSRTERAYLFELARKQDPKHDHTRSEAVPSAIGRVLDSIASPAYALDHLWHACGWNSAAGHLFDAWLHGPQMNLLRYVFCDPAAQGFIHDWETRANRLVAEFRADTSRIGEDPDVSELVAGLRRDSAVFDEIWRSRDVLGREGGLRGFVHPVDGFIHYDQVTLRLAEHDRFKLVMLLPAVEDPP